MQKEISDVIVAELKEKFPTLLEHESMAKHTFLKIGGPARLYLMAVTAMQIQQAVDAAMKLDIPFTVIGGGSNLLVSDDGYTGLVIECANRTVTILGTEVISAPGVYTALLAKQTVDAGLTGFEWGVGVPGKIGGATYGNAGCFGGEMKDSIEWVEAYSIKAQNMKRYLNKECKFGYRTSRFTYEPHVILRTCLRLKTGDIVDGKKKIDEIAFRRKESQPQGAFSAGCLFKNAEFSDVSEISKLMTEREVPKEYLDAKRIPAGWLIDQLGLKGTTVGNAQVSPVHGNFLINLGGATAQDVISLSSLVKMKVRDDLGVLLEDEVQLLGF